MRIQLATPRVQEPTARSPDRNINIERGNSSTMITTLASLSGEPPLKSTSHQPQLIAHRDSSLLRRGGDSFPRKFPPYPSFTPPSGVHNTSNLPLYSSPEQHQAMSVPKRCSHGHEGASDAGGGRPNGGIFHDQKLCQLLDAAGKPGLGREVRKLIRKAVEERVQELSKLAQDVSLIKEIFFWSGLGLVLLTMNPPVSRSREEGGCSHIHATQDCSSFRLHFSSDLLKSLSLPPSAHASMGEGALRPHRHA